MVWRVRSLLVALVAVATFAVLGTSAVRATAPPSPWDGTNPFNCVVQDAGLGPAGPDPNADPYCVRFDKTHQNISQLGIADFLLKEPARVAAAAPKCFYFQEDHWRGSFTQSDRTAVYEFEGHYFFNKATGDGGAWVTGFTVNGETFDPTTLPGFPPGYGRYFGPGTGGFITHDDVPTDPQCAALAKQHSVDATPTGPHCVPGAGRIKRAVIGPVSLGEREDAVRASLGAPGQVKRGFLRYCVAGGGALLVGQRGDRSGTLGDGGHAATVMLLTTAHGFLLLGRHGHRVTVGTGRRALARAFAHPRQLARLRQARILRLRTGIVAAIRHRHVIALVIYDRRTIRQRATLKRYLRRSL